MIESVKTINLGVNRKSPLGKTQKGSPDKKRD